jgi:acetate kinase
MPAPSYIYAVPYDWYEKHAVRRYGFHGTSFLYTSKRAATLLGKDFHKCNLIIAHLGNGSSINAVKDGCSFDTSMGLSPLEGLVMGTRSGDVDPAVPFYMMRAAGLSAAEAESILNKKSGLLGITGQFTDRRDIQAAVEKGDARAELAQDIEAHRIKKYIGGYMAVLGRLDALVFTAGVGEMAPFIRDKVLRGLEGVGIVYDREKNRIAKTRNAETLISKPESKIPIYIIPTDEELVMTEDAYALMAGTYDLHTKFTYSFQDRKYVNKARAESLVKDLEKNPALASLVVTAP